MFEWNEEFFNENEIAGVGRETGNRVLVQFARSEKFWTYSFPTKQERDKCLKEFGEAWMSVLKAATVAVMLLLALPCFGAKPTWGIIHPEGGCTWGMLEQVETVDIKTNVTTKPVFGGFWTEWQVLEDKPQRTRATMEWQADPITNNAHYLTNIAYGSWDTYIVTNFQWSPPPCTKEHLDSTPQSEQTYTQSNLLAHLSWRGKTNTWCLESLCVHTNTRTWHWDKQKVYNK